MRKKAQPKKTQTERARAAKALKSACCNAPTYQFGGFGVRREIVCSQCRARVLR